MRPEIDYYKIGQRIKVERQERILNQSKLGKLVGCSNNHMSHIETGQRKVSLPLLLRISFALEKDLNYYLLDMPYEKGESIANGEIFKKLEKCSATTLVSVSKIIVVLLKQQNLLHQENEGEPDI